MNRTELQNRSGPWPEISVEDNAFHPIDFQDVSISEYAIKIILGAAKALINERMPEGPKNVSPQQAIAMFIDHLFWEENSGGLVMCADLDSRSYCLAIPREHWSLADRGLLN